MPEWYLEGPELQDCDMFYLTAFKELSSCRTMGMSPGPIPWRDIMHYAQYHQLDEELTNALVIIIRTMDNEFLKYIQENKEDK